MILLTGATGYVGGRLLRVLESEGRPVRCLVRRPDEFRHRVLPSTEIVGGDVGDPVALERALAGVESAFYLVHSMGASEDFEQRDRAAASAFGHAAAAAGVRRIVYLGGLGDSTTDLSTHLRSRHEVGRVLADSGVETIELRASIIIGSGSLSFDLIRSLVERLPAMVTPRWVDVLAQPIGIEDVLAYLIGALDAPATGSRVYEIGGPDRVSYGDLMREYARQRGLTRFMIPVPLLTPRLSSLWLRLVTPIYAEVGRKLIDSICHPTLVEDDAALRAFPIRPLGVRECIERALANEDRECAETRWSDAISAGAPAQQWARHSFGNRFVDTRSVFVAVEPDRAFRPIGRIGGNVGWYASNRLWQLRGMIDLLVGGVGVRRGRRDPEELRVGDALDFWRVEAIEPGRRLRLAAEMRLPGRAWLEFTVDPEPGGSRIRQTAEFDPVGLAGLAYWYGIFPLHQRVFRGMIEAIAHKALATPVPRASG